ncbi:LUD domain-containing protein [Halorhabdus salina]|uniref:LUD domain-containing protein n=1 Tax=Halorhabdus salina TaxID=2750670 RepID=UPI0015EF48FD|nr:LUD domain-containing protein [Halorhabdus salina]
MSQTTNESPVEQFTTSLAEIEVDWTTTGLDDIESTLTALIESPAVGVELPIDGVTLPERVETNPDPTAIRTATTGVTPATLAIADYGSVVLESDPNGSELMSLFSGTHVVVIEESDIVGSMAEAFEALGPHLREERGDAIVATGASATSDMGALVRGVHGPKHVHIVIIES